VSRSRRALTPIGRLAVAAVAAGLIPAVAACDAGNDAPTLQFHEQSAGVDSAIQGIQIRDAFVLGPGYGASIATGQSAGVFLALYNNGTSADRLLRATSSAAKSVVIPSGGIGLGAAQIALLTGPHAKIVLTGLTKPLAGGTTVSVTLYFMNAGSITLSLPVIPRAGEYATFAPPPAPTPTPSTSVSGKPGTSPTSVTATSPPPTSAPPTPTPTS
jgi:copper(I)-binding protein